MGITLSTIQICLAELKKYPMSGKVLTLGVQGVEGSYQQVETIFKTYGWDYPTLPREEIVYTHMQYGYTIHQSVLFKMLGFSQVESMDAFDVDDPTYIYDLNEPIADMGYQYDLVYDGGTVEHIFDIKTAMFNIVKLVKVGGIVVHHAPMNDYINHGFYQFSPTFFADFYLSNGFGNVSIIIDYGASIGYRRCSTVEEAVGEIQGSGGGALVYFAAQKVRDLKEPVIPTQSIYKKLAAAAA